MAGATLLFAPDRSGPLTFVVTQLPAGAVEGLPEVPGRMLPAPFGDGSRILLVAPRTAPRLLTGGFHGALDPEISFDGRRMLFSGKRSPDDPWLIYELDLDGGDVRKVTSGEGDHRSPVYLSSFYTIDSAEPWDQLAFVSDQAGELNEYGAGRSTSIYTARLDGTSVHRITSNPSSDLTPVVLPDGRILFAGWQRSTLRHGLRGRISLFASQSDGLDHALFSGDEGRRIKMMPAVTTDRKVVFVEGDSVGWDGAGRLASVSLRRNLHSYREVTAGEDGLFHSPSPLAGGEVLASRRPAGGGGTHAVVRLTPGTGEWTEIFDDPDHHDIQAKAVAARLRPDGRSSIVSEAFDHGALYGLNLYISEPGREWIEPGTPVSLRILEGLPFMDGQAREAVEGSPPLIPRRILGELPVEEDGSFHVKIPVGVPVQLQVVDGDGMALRSCDWLWVRNRETRGCIGCHEDGERTPPNRFVKAVAKPPADLTGPAQDRRTIDFTREIHPILEAKCSVAACHGGDGALPELQGQGASARRAYRALLAPEFGAEPDAGRYVHPGSARKSPLISSLFGREVARSWDVDHKPCAVPPMPPVGWEPLTREEKRALVEWIDLGASWTGAPAGDPAREASGDSP